MNVYDFDNTIYDGDSSIDFFLFCLRRHKQIWRCLPGQCLAMLKYALHYINKRRWKETFFSFVKYVPDISSEIVAFWDCNERKIRQWYLEQHKTDDVIISASPDFLLQPICERIGVQNLIASQVDPYTGKFLSENCHGQQKVIRFQERFPGGTVERFYSDSTSDLPMTELAKEAFLVQKKHITKWEIDR